MLCRGNRLLTGSNTRRIRLWSVAAVQELREKGSDARYEEWDGGAPVLTQD